MVTEYLSSAYNVTSSNFSSNNATVDVSYSVTVDDTKLPNGHYLVLDYNVPNPGNTSYQRYGSYTFAIQNGPTTPPQPSYGEGNLVTTTDQKVYSIMDGYARHIQNMATLAGVYNYNGYIISCNCSTLSKPIGSPIGSDTSLLIDTTNGKMYFREGTYIRHIKDVPTANKYFYQIYNNNYIVSVTSLSGYTVGPQIQ